MLLLSRVTRDAQLNSCRLSVFALHVLAFFTWSLWTFELAHSLVSKSHAHHCPSAVSQQRQRSKASSLFWGQFDLQAAPGALVYRYWQLAVG